MTGIRIGTYAVTIFHAVIYTDGNPLAECVHSHLEQSEATECARSAKLFLKDHGITPPNWVPYVS